MMSVMKQVVVLLLMLGAISTNAELGNETCSNLGATLPPEDLHKIFGDWVLLSYFADSNGAEMLNNLSSSRVELQLHSDNHTIKYNERNQFHFSNNSCTMFLMNMTLPSASDDHVLHINTPFLFEKDGVVSELNDTVSVTFYETCSDCLILVYKGEMGQFLLTYWREGHLQHIDPMEVNLSHNEELAECLGIPNQKRFTYDENADFCHKKSSPEETTE